MRDIAISLKKDYYDDNYILTIEKLSKEEAQQIMNTVVFPTEKQNNYITLADISYYQQKAWIQAIKLFNESELVKTGAKANKIETIKFLRGISNLGLKESKELVEYVLWEGTVISGLKFTED